MGMAAPIYFTAEMVRALPDDGNRYEVVRGELLVTPAPRLWHQEIVLRMAETIREYPRREPVGHLQPDLFVVPLEQARTLEWSRITELRLVAEVLSPSSPRADRFTKRGEYQRRGVPVYWIVNPDDRQVELWTPADTFPQFERERLRWHPTGAGTAFEVELSQLFKPI